MLLIKLGQDGLARPILEAIYGLDVWDYASSYIKAMPKALRP